MKKDKLNNLQVIKILTILVIIFLTLFRIYLAMNIPVYINSHAGYDDMLFIKYAETLIRGEWLGQYDYITLTKGISYSVFLIFAKVLSKFLFFPYTLTLILFYIFSILVFIKSISKFVKEKFALAVIYIFLLYSPVMLYTEYFTRLYRTAIWIPSILLVISCLIAMFFYQDEKSSKKLIFWSVGSGVSFSFFWFIREDSIWLLPLFLGSIVVTIIYILIAKNSKKQKLLRSLVCFIPIAIFLLSSNLISFINYKEYGLYTTQDRTKTYFADVLALLIKIEDSNTEDAVWISHEAFEMAMEVSPTFKSIQPQIEWVYNESSWKTDHGEIFGDIIFWAFKQAVWEAGYYRDAPATNQFYKKIYNELEDGFATGKLVEKDVFYISETSVGKKWEDMPLVFDYMKAGFRATAMYDMYYINIQHSVGFPEDLQRVEQIVDAKLIREDESKDSEVYLKSTPALNISRKILRLYQNLSSPLLILSGAGFILCIVRIFTQKDKDMYIKFLIISVGLLLSYVLLIFGTAWFSTFAFDRRDLFMSLYTGGATPVFQIFQMLNIYIIFKSIKNYINKKRRTN